MSKRRSAAEIFGIALDDRFLVLRLLHEAKRARADGVPRKIGAGVSGNDAYGRRNQVHAERSIRFSAMDDDRGRIRSFNGPQQPKRAALGRFVCRISDKLERALHVGGSERTAIVEANAASEMEKIRGRIRSFPGFRRSPWKF